MCQKVYLKWTKNYTSLRVTQNWTINFENTQKYAILQILSHPNVSSHKKDQAQLKKHMYGKEGSWDRERELENFFSAFFITLSSHVQELTKRTLQIFSFFSKALLQGPRSFRNVNSDPEKLLSSHVLKFNRTQEYYITLKLGWLIGDFMKCQMSLSSTNHLIFSPFWPIWPI